MNVLRTIKRLGYYLSIGFNENWNISCIRPRDKEIVIGVQSELKDMYDIDFLCTMHEVSHALDEDIFLEEQVEREVKAWKIAFNTFVPEQPEIRLRMLRVIQWQILHYVSAYVYDDYSLAQDKNLNHTW